MCITSRPAELHFGQWDMTGCSPCIWLQKASMFRRLERKEAIILQSQNFFLQPAYVRNAKTREKPGTLAIFLGNSTGFLKCSSLHSAHLLYFLNFYHLDQLSVCSLEWNTLFLAWRDRTRTDISDISKLRWALSQLWLKPNWIWCCISLKNNF